MLCEPDEDINSTTDCITEYIKFYENTTLPAWTIHCFPNNKPWITRDLKDLLNKKKRAFRSGDREELRRVQRDLRVKLRECKDPTGGSGRPNFSRTTPGTCGQE